MCKKPFSKVRSMMKRRRPVSKKDFHNGHPRSVSKKVVAKKLRGMMEEESDSDEEQIPIRRRAMPMMEDESDSDSDEEDKREPLMLREPMMLQEPREPMMMLQGRRIVKEEQDPNMTYCVKPYRKGEATIADRAKSCSLGGREDGAIGKMSNYANRQMCIEDCHTGKRGSKKRSHSKRKNASRKRKNSSRKRKNASRKRNNAKANC